MPRPRFLLPFLALPLAACLPQGEAAAPPASPQAEAAPPARPTDPPRAVQAAEIRHLPAPQGAAFTGTVRARREADVGFRTGGRIAARLVNLGDVVEAGQPLLRLDPADLTLAVSSAEADVLSAEAQAVQAANEAGRSRQLLAAGHVSTAFHEAREATARSAAQRLAAARAQLGLARNRLDYAVLHAPGPGIVTAVLAEAGQVVAEGVPVLRIADPAEREVLVQLPETHVATARAARVTFWARPEAGLPAVLREVAAQADPGLRTYAARFSLPDAPDWVRLGMTATLRLGGAEAPSGARIPLTALHDRGQGPMVWRILEDGRIEAVPVTVQALTETTATIAATIPEGTPIVAMGAQLLSPASRVRVVDTRLAGALR